MRYDDTDSPILSTKFTKKPVVYLLNSTSNHNVLYAITALAALYIFWILHQTTTYRRVRNKFLRCISFDSYIKPQLREYLTYCTRCCISFDSYIKPQHAKLRLLQQFRSISFDSYIKPQPVGEYGVQSLVVYLLTPTSNHNYNGIRLIVVKVVYLLTPTSNHNGPIIVTTTIRLYIFWLLHQTTTCYK